MNIRSVAIQREHWTVSRCLTALSGFPFFPIPSIMRWMGYHCSCTLGQNNGNALIQAIQRTYKPSITACQVGCCIIWHSHQNCHLIVLLVQFRRRESLDWSGARRRGTYWLLSNEKEFEHIFWSHWLCDSIKIRTVKKIWSFEGKKLIDKCQVKTSNHKFLDMKITTAVSMQILIGCELVFGLSLTIVRTWLVYAVCSINHNTRKHIETIRYNYYWSQLWQVCYALCSAEAILAEQTHTNGPSCANGKAQVRGRIINNSQFELCIHKKQTNIFSTVHTRDSNVLCIV